MRKRDWGVMVRKVLQKHVLSQAELANICNVSQQTVSSWKLGSRIPGFLHRRQLIDLYNSRNIGKPDSMTLADMEQKKELLDEEKEELSKKPQDWLSECFHKLPVKCQQEIAEFAKAKLLEHSLANKYLDCKMMLERTRKLLDILPGVAWGAEFDKKYVFRMIYVSPNLGRLSGFPDLRFNLNEDGWTSIIHPEDRDGYINYHNNVVRNKLTRAILDYRIINPDGRVIVVRDKRSVKMVEDGSWWVGGILSLRIFPDPI